MKKIKIAMLALALAVTGCNKTDTGKDGYVFHGGDSYNTSFVTEVVTYPSSETLGQAASERGVIVAKGEEVAAFAVLSADEDKCTIHMIDPKVHYEPEFYGHELVHCVYGHWHK